MRYFFPFMRILALDSSLDCDIAHTKQQQKKNIQRAESAFLPLCEIT